MKDSGTSHVSESMDFSGADEAISAGLALRRYTTRKQQIASEIRRLMNLSKGSFREKWNEDLHQLMVKLAEDRFVLSVAGQFNRGKSSLMNAIIGRDVLPTGVLPVTSVVTILKYGTVDRLLVHLDGRRLPLEVPLLTLAQYVTQEGNPGNEKKVLRAMVETPSPLLRRGIEFVDTPGVGSAVDSNTLTTLEFLPQSDAVIFVMSAEAPCTNAECEFLDRVRSHVRKIFFVLNKIDLLCEQEKESVVQSVERTLRNRLHDESIRIFPVSSLKSLRTSSDVDSPGRGDGGLRELEGTLSAFITGDKAEVFLTSVLDRSLIFVKGMMGETWAEKTTSRTQPDGSEGPSAQLKEQLNRMHIERKRLFQEFRNHIHEWLEMSVSKEVRAFLGDEIHALLENMTQLMQASRWESSHRLVRHFTRQVIDHFRENLIPLVEIHTERLNEELHEMIGRQCLIFAGHIEKVRLACGDFPRTEDPGKAAGEREYECPVHCIPVPPNLFIGDWSPQIPLWQRVLPVRAAGKGLRRRLSRSLIEYVEGYENRFLEVFVSNVNDILRSVQDWVYSQVTLFESRTLNSIESEPDRDPEKVREDRLTDVDAKIAKLKDSEIRLRNLRRDILGLHQPEDGREHLLLDPVRQERELADVGLELIKLESNRIIQDLRSRGCSAYNRVSEAVMDYLASWQHALVSDENARLRHASDHGFCPLHTWQLYAMTSPHCICVGYPKLMEHLSKELVRISRVLPDEPDAVLSLVPDGKTCRICRHVKEMEINYLNALSGILDDCHGRQVYSVSDGLCLKHLGMILAMKPSDDVKRFLVAEASRCLSEIAEDMQNSSLKYDALRRDLRNEHEENAHLRGIVRIVGSRAVSMPWRMEEG